VERCEELAKGVGGRAAHLDVTDPESVTELVAAVPEVSVLVNNAGGALGLEPIAEADEEKWRRMYDTNVLGVMRVTKALLPALERSGDGFVVVIGSIAGHEV
jgi:NADP-dependent 3-hydroxy acid dehydrogenase YdfG